MSEVLRLRAVALSRSGRGLELSVRSGEAVAIMGPAGAGKTQLLRLIAGLDDPAHGRVEIGTRVAFAGAAMPRRGRVQALARLGGPGQASRATDALTAVGLWDMRQHAIADLSPGQAAAAELLAPLAGDAGLIAIDSQLDDLDPWAFRSALSLLAKRRRDGAAVAVVTHRPEVAAACDFLLVLRAKQPVYAGSISDLLADRTQTMEIVAENPKSAAAIVKPFTVHAKQKDGALELRAEEGQQLAARLLSQGYGDVKLIVERNQTLEDAILTLIGS